MLLRKAMSTLVAGAMALSAAAAQAATVTCGGTMPKTDGTTMFTATPIYISGSSAVEPMLKIIGAKLASQATNPYVLIYANDGSCAGVNRINTTGLIAKGTAMKYVPPDLVAGAASPTCNIDANNDQPGDLVLADADATLCPGISAQPANTMDWNGPANNMVLVVPSQSTQTAISAEDVYLIFGLGAAGEVMPWVDPTAFFIRTPDSGTRAMIAANSKLGSATWQGQTGPSTGGNYGSGSLFTAVANNGATAAEKTIGILGSDYLDQGTNRQQVKSLAFRAFGQHLAYWPDSSVTSYDKKNVREGRYAIWGFLHMLATVASGASTPTSSGAQYFISLITGTLQSPPFNVNDAITDSHYVPQCAMKVTHDIEGGDLKPYTPAEPCGCYFDSRILGSAAPGCMACTADTDCTGAGASHCRFGYCEAN